MSISIFLILVLFPYVIVMLFGEQADHSSSVEAAMETDLEVWVLELLPGQMSASYDLEALKAQAVIIRSNLVYRMQNNGVEAEALNKKLIEEWGFTGYSQEELQELWSQDVFASYYEKLQKAVEETAGQILVYEGKYVDLPYHAVSAGKTREGSLLGEEYSYLKSVECPGDLEAENYLTIMRKEFAEDVEILKRDKSDYVVEVRVGKQVMAGEAFRTEQGLFSSCFTMQEQNGTWIVITKGLGHGFGLSMYQAQLQASQGKTFLEILGYFYEGTECISFFESGYPMDRV